MCNEWFYHFCQDEFPKLAKIQHYCVFGHTLQMCDSGDSATGKLWVQWLMLSTHREKVWVWIPVGPFCVEFAWSSRVCMGFFSQFNNMHLWLFGDPTLHLASLLRKERCRRRMAGHSYTGTVGNVMTSIWSRKVLFSAVWSFLGFLDINNLIGRANEKKPLPEATSKDLKG